MLLLLGCNSDGAKLVLLLTLRCAPPKLKVLDDDPLLALLIRQGVPRVLLLIQPAPACSSSSAGLDKKFEVERAATFKLSWLSLKAVLLPF
jgi:hypothetical protein